MEYLNDYVSFVVFDDLLLFRCDLLFEDVESLKDKINKMDTSFVSFIIQNDVGNLINLGI